MTYLEIINRVLSKMREATVTAISDPYPTLIGIFVNEAKKDVEDAWNWTCLRTLIPVTVAAADSTSVYALANSTQRTRILDVWNATKKGWLRPITSEYLHMLQTTVPTQTGSPTYYCVTGVSTASTMEVTLWPKGDDDYTINFNTINPQAELSTTTTAITVPADPVVQGAYLRAIIERGEDNGNMSQTQEEVYRFSLGSAVSQDVQHHTEEVVWQAI